MYIPKGMPGHFVQNSKNFAKVTQETAKGLKPIHTPKFESYLIDEIIMSGAPKPRNAAELKESLLAQTLTSMASLPKLPKFEINKINQKMSENMLEYFSKNTFLQNRNRV